MWPTCRSAGRDRRPRLLEPAQARYGRLMKLDAQDIQQFAHLWEQEFGETLTLEVAERQARLLLELYLTLARPLPANREPNKFLKVP